jgi:secreted PhoX family phosphatase
MQRRDFLRFMGVTGFTISNLSLLSSCKPQLNLLTADNIIGIAPSDLDEFILATGLEYQQVVRWGDIIGHNMTFGFANDFNAFFPLENNRALLWTNHEDVDPLFVSDFKDGDKDRMQVELEMDNVGGTIIEIARQPATGRWVMVPRSAYNRRITAHTVFPFAWPEKIMGSDHAIGTLANCAGGKTPWGNVLTCEENFQTFYGDYDYTTKKSTLGQLQWEKFHARPTQHYGWVVEINPTTGQGKKLVALGRFGHEGATISLASDGRCVVYMGDDKEDEFLYKFIASKPNSLEEGTLYVASLEQGRWLSLKREDSEILQKTFKNQTEIQIYARLAAKLIGATPLDRPEDIEINPHNKSILVALTNNKSKGNYFGSILSLQEKNNDPLSLEFSSSTFITGGESTGFACPDNLIFDRMGNLWFTSDISHSKLNKTPYTKFKNNGLFFIAAKGAEAGKVIQLASAPINAELTGPCFSEDGETLFLSVQHPGEGSTDKEKPLSHWPDGGGMPSPAVVQINGPLLKKIQGL